MGLENRYSESIINLLRDPEARLAWEEERILERFALDVEKVLKSKGMSQAQLAREAGLAPQSVSRALSGSQNLTVKMMLKVSMAMGHTIEIGTPPLEDLSQSVVYALDQEGFFVDEPCLNDVYIIDKYNIPSSSGVSMVCL